MLHGDSTMWHVLEIFSQFKGWGSLNGDGGHDGTPGPRMAMSQGKNKRKMVKWANIRAKNENQINGDRASRFEKSMKARAKAFGFENVLLCRTINRSGP